MKLTTVVAFGRDAGPGEAALELDDAAHPDGNVPCGGAPVYFLLYLPPGVLFAGAAASAGNIVDEGEVTRRRSERLEVVDEKPVPLRHAPSGGIEWTWHGKQPLAVLVAGGQAIVTGERPLVADVSYDVRFRRLRLDPPSTAGRDGEFPVVVVAYLEEDEP